MGTRELCPLVLMGLPGPAAANKQVPDWAARSSQDRGDSRTLAILPALGSPTYGTALPPPQPACLSRHVAQRRGRFPATSCHSPGLAQPGAPTQHLTALLRQPWPGARDMCRPKGSSGVCPKRGSAVCKTFFLTLLERGTAIFRCLWLVPRQRGSSPTAAPLWNCPSSRQPQQGRFTRPASPRRSAHLVCRMHCGMWTACHCNGQTGLWLTV